MIKRWWFLLPLIAVTAISFSALSSGVLVFTDMMNRTVRSWERIVEVDVFLRNDITPDQQASLEGRIKAISQVSSYRYISKKDALAEFRQLNPKSSALISDLEEDALPASYRIRLKEPAYADEVSTRLEGQPGVEEINFGGQDVQTLLTVTKLVARGATAVPFVVAGLLLMCVIAIRSIRTPKYA